MSRTVTAVILVMRSSCERPHPKPLSLNQFLLLFPKSGDAEAHGLAGLQIDRVRLLSHAHAGRRAGRDYVARLQAHEMAEIRDQLRHIEDHGPGAAVLVAVA